MPNDPISSAVASYGETLAAKFAPGNPGEPEDQLRGPTERLLEDLGALYGLSVVPVGEVHLTELATKPDFAVIVDGLQTGHLELKKPGTGVDVTRFRGHNRQQWKKLSALPNLLYSDGDSWALYRGGELVGEAVRLNGDVRTSGADLRPPDGGSFERLMASFLKYEPIKPTSALQLAERVADLCRLLSEEVLEALESEESALVADTPFQDIQKDWQALLFPKTTASEFADHYAQTVTFALLLASYEGEDLTEDLAAVAHRLGDRHGLLGRALTVLTDDTLIRHISTSVGTLLRLLSVVDWAVVSSTPTLPGFTATDSPWLYFYETFLSRYNPELRRKAGAYYTPPQVVGAQVRLVEDVLRRRLGKNNLGFADSSVVVLDPAMGTGGYLVRTVNQAAALVADREGLAAVGGRIEDLATRLIGFELMSGPLAVAELLVSESVRQWTEQLFTSEPLRLYLTDTLADPYVEETRLGGLYEPIAETRRKANEIKRDERVFVCLGNPPYDLHDSEDDLGGWVVDGHGVAPPIWDDFLVDIRGTDAATDLKPIYNLYAYFWRWALWKVFEAHEDSQQGVVAFISASSFLQGPGFGGMRAHMRRLADEIHVIDLGGEGHGARRDDNVFDIQTPVAITIVVRRDAPDSSQAAKVKYTRISGSRLEKYQALDSVQTVDDLVWSDCYDGWTESFMPVSPADWRAYPALLDLFPWGHPGVGQNRTWPTSPRSDELIDRWKSLGDSDVFQGGTAKLANPPEDSREALLKETRDRYVGKVVRPLPGQPSPTSDNLAAEDLGDCLTPIRFGWRSFDRQYLIPDSRVLDMPRPVLWETHGENQLYIATQHQAAIGTGPAVTFSALIPDLNFFNNRGGRAIPLWRDRMGSEPNVAPGLLGFLTGIYELDVTAEDLASYVAAVMGSYGYSRHFYDELEQPGPRVPITRDASIFAEAVSIGQEVISLHTFAHGAEGGEQGIARVIDPIAHDRPESTGYDADKSVVMVGDGSIGPVSSAVGNYDISGMKVIDQWLAYRRRRPAGRSSSKLDAVLRDDWPVEWTTDLLELIWTLEALVGLEPAQVQLLGRVLESDIVSVADLETAGVLPVPDIARDEPRMSPSGTSPFA